MDKDFWNDSYKQDAGSVEVADQLLDRELNGLALGTALDLGCGLGTNALKLAQRGWSVVGVDWAEYAIELARACARERELDATFYVGDVTTWKPPGEFDLVLSTYALPAGEDMKLALGTALKALAPGGTLIVVEWDRSMSEAWGFDESDLPTPQEIVDGLSGLLIEVAEIRQLRHAFPAEGTSDNASPGDDHSGNDSHLQDSASVAVAYVRARKP